MRLERKPKIKLKSYFLDFFFIIKCFPLSCLGWKTLRGGEKGFFGFEGFFSKIIIWVSASCFVGFGPLVLIFGGGNGLKNSFCFFEGGGA